MDFGGSDRLLFWAAAAAVLFIGFGLVGILQRSIRADFKGKKAPRAAVLRARIVRDSILIGAAGLALFLGLVPLLVTQPPVTGNETSLAELSGTVEAHEKRLDYLAREQVRLTEKIDGNKCEDCGGQTALAPTSVSAELRRGAGALLFIAGIAMLAAGIFLIWSGAILVWNSRGADH